MNTEQTVPQKIPQTVPPIGQLVSLAARQSKPAKPASRRSFFETIVVVTDLTDSESFPLLYAQALAHRHHAKLVLLHSLDPRLCLLGDAEPAEGADASSLRQELAALDQKALAHLHSPVERDAFFDEILSEVRRHGATLLVLGSQGQGFEARRALGRMARELLLHAPCPILVVGPANEASLATAGYWRKVLAATDFSTSAIAGLHHAHQLAQEHLTALHCIRCSKTTRCANCLEKLRFLAPFNESHTVPVEHIVESGEAGSLIVKSAGKLHPDLIVLGSPSETLSLARLSTSTVCEVIENALCPVLLTPDLQVPAPEQPVAHQLAYA